MERTHIPASAVLVALIPFGNSAPAGGTSRTGPTRTTRRSDTPAANGPEPAPTETKWGGTDV